MRRPTDIPRRRSIPRGRVGVVIGVVIVVIVLASLRGTAVFYTDFLWFQGQGLSQVWTGILGTKIALAAAFILLFFALAWGNLAVVDRLSMRSLATGPEDELVQRYRLVVGPRARLVRTLVAGVLALLVGTGASSQWNNWLLFRNAVAFPWKDPQFHTNASFFVFKLPLLSFFVSWCLAALVVVALAVAAVSYLTGGIRPQGPAPRVSPHVKAHLSLLIGAMALVKAAGYFLQRYELDSATDGYREGAFYTDVHAKLPALTLLIFISLFAFVILLVNIRRRGWVLPVIAVGLWAFISLVIGTIYPALVQRFSVDPSQQTKELRYISRNIHATRYAMEVQNVRTQPFAYSQNVTPSQLEAHAQSLSDVRIWDPAQASDAFNKLQDIRSYYNFNTLSVNRMTIGGQAVPVVIGAREINPSQLLAQSWVNVHLQYTHGYGAAMAPANTATSEGNPSFVIGDVPPTSSKGAPVLKQPRVYFGVEAPVRERQA
ncbi:MAG: UPF0182 family protein, partial [Acidimicrobiales bacterium]